MLDFETSFVNTNGVIYPDTEAINVSAPGAGDGTEFVAILVNHIWGQAQALLNYSGMTPDGVQEADGTAQILDALAHGYGIGPGVGVIYWKNDTPAIHGDRVLLFQGQEISQVTYALLFAVVYCGDAANATAPAFYSTNGAGVRMTPGAGGTHFVIPDSRGLSLKNIGDATIAGRTKVGPVELGEMQEDQFQDWQVGGVASAKNFYGRITADITPNAGALVNNCVFYGQTTSQGIADGMYPVDDGTNGTPRTGLNTRDSSLGTNFGITY